MQNVNNSLQSVLTSIIADRENWEANELATSNKRLYSILSRCYAVFVDHKETDEGRKKVNEAAVALGVSFNKATSTAAKVIKIIFGDDNRHRASDYAQVLKIAAAKDVKKADFETWLSNAGGIYAVLRGTEETAEQKKADLTTALDKGMTKLQQLGTIGSVAPHANIQGRNGYVLVLGYVDGNGALSVIKTVGTPDSDQVKAEIRRLANAKDMSAKTTANASVPTNPVTNIAAASDKAQADAIAAAIAAGTTSDASTTQQPIAA
jgi:hypothetical protein